MKTWRFLTILLASLSMAMAFSHLLQLPQRMSYDVPQYLTTQGLFRLYAVVGAPIEVGAIAASIVLIILTQKRVPAHRLTLAGTICLIAALAMWFIFVAPANASIATWSPESFPADWTAIRTQWEYAHAARAVLLIAGLSLFVWPVLAETPAGRVRPPLARTE